MGDELEKVYRELQKIDQEVWDELRAERDELIKCRDVLVGTAKSLLAILNDELSLETELEAPWGYERRALRKAVDEIGGVE